MRVRIVEDELSRRMPVQRFLRDIDACHSDVAVNGPSPRPMTARRTSARPSSQAMLQGAW